MKHQSYWTITAAIRTRAWARAFHRRNGRQPNDDEIALVVDKFQDVDKSYVTQAVKEMSYDRVLQA